MKYALTLFLIATSIPAFASEMDSFYDQMKFLAQRDRIISQNIANADTPQYRPKDIRKSNKDVSGVFVNRTNSMHMDLDDDSTDFELVMADINEIKPNGNAVTLETELLKKSENSLKLMEATNLYNKSRSMLRAAIVGNK
jgi:flagellar basal-body rod protein FlgB